MALGDDEFALRIELFQDSDNARSFRADVWRAEHYRIQSTFPQDPSTGEPEHHPSDEVVMVDWSTFIRTDRNYRHFEAENAEAALDGVMADIQRTIDHALGC